MTNSNKYNSLMLAVCWGLLSSCQPLAPAVTPVSIPDSIPSDAIKFSPEMDATPPILHSDEWEQPVPLPGAPTTAGLEDSPFITPDGSTLYFFFTPDADIPAEGQLVDGVTGIYVSEKTDDIWGPPQRVVLQDPGKLAMDGCIFVQDEVIWFCSVREGNLRDIDIWTAENQNGAWVNWQNAGEQLNLQYWVGELHITTDGLQLYYHSDREGGLGGRDIWVLNKVGGQWGPPENVSAVNTASDEGWPYVSPDGSELWFTRTYQGTPAIFRSMKGPQGWEDPELIVSQFAEEPTLDAAGNLYFVHHYIVDGQIWEADIYVALKTSP